MNSLDVTELRRLIEAYVRTLNGKDMKEWYTTQRGLTQNMLGRFVEWIERDGRTRGEEADRTAAGIDLPVTLTAQQAEAIGPYRMRAPQDEPKASRADERIMWECEACKAMNGSDDVVCHCCCRKRPVVNRNGDE